MVRLILFFVLIALFSTLMAWFADNKGDVSMVWLGYRIDTSVMFLVCAFGALLLVVVGITSGIKKWQNRKQIKRTDRTLQEVTRSFSAIESGDIRTAKQASKRVAKLVNHKKSHEPIVHLLEANIAKQEGDEALSEEHYGRLLEYRDTEMAALHGLLHQATARGDYTKAIELGEKAARKQPKSEAVITLLLGLYKHEGDWEKFDHQLEKVKKSIKKAKLKEAPLNWEHEKALSCFMLAHQCAQKEDKEMAFSLLEECINTDASFTPATLQAMEWYEEVGKGKKILSLVEKSWRKCPHPMLSKFYVEFGDASTIRQTRRAAKLYKLNNTTLESQLMMARVYSANAEYDLVRKHLDNAVLFLGGEEASVREVTDLMLGVLNAADITDAHAVEHWQELQENARVDSAWKCSNCGNSVDVWQLSCSHCDAIDTIKWCEPCPQLSTELTENPLGEAGDRV